MRATSSPSARTARSRPRAISKPPRPGRDRAVHCHPAMPAQIKGPPKVLTSPGHSFSDVARKVVSIINLASLPRHRGHGRAARPSAAASAPTSMSRAGRPGTNSTSSTARSRSASARLKAVKRITRCAAVNVDPDTAERDLAIPQALQRRLGHGDCGIYAEVITGGSIAVSDARSWRKSRSCCEGISRPGHERHPRIQAMTPRSRGADSARSFANCPSARGARAPDARCTRGLVCKIVQRSAHEHTGSARQSGIPCAGESMGKRKYR